MKKKIFLLCLLLINSLYANELSSLLDIDSLKDNRVHYIQKNCLDVLASEKRDSIKKYYPDIEKLTYYWEAADKFVYWNEQHCYRNIFISINEKNGYDVLEIGEDEIGTGFALSFLIEEYNYKDGFWYLTVHEIYSTKTVKNSNVLNKWPIKTDECVIIIKIDGDYIDVYINDLNQYYDTFCKINDLTLASYNYFIKNDICDLRNVTWPRHADGTCDYDGSSKSTKPEVLITTISSTNVAKNKTMSVTENLKLRSGEVTTTSVLTVMSAGTKVKILELGKAETIDGIDSNWVKVEVQKGAKDRDGKEIKPGTIGWCYGGYLK